MDIVPICHEISTNKGKVFDEIREVFKFLNLEEGVYWRIKQSMPKEDMIFILLYLF